MKELSINDSIRFSLIEALCTNLNVTLKADELARLIKEELDELSEEERQETLDGQTPTEYFDEELNALELYTVEEKGEDCKIGETFVVLMEPDGDAAASFVLTGYAGEGIFNCCYITNSPYTR